jgi:hypothetical protein
MQGRWLESPATRADVIGWTVTVPVVLWAVASLPGMVTLPSKYGAMSEEFGVPVPPMLSALFALGDFGVAALLTAVVLAPIVVLLWARRSAAKVVVPVAAAVLVSAIYWILLSGSLEMTVAIGDRMR